jgi:hypothetical protein
MQTAKPNHGASANDKAKKADQTAVRHRLD